MIWLINGHAGVILFVDCPYTRRGHAYWTTVWSPSLGYTLL